MATSIRIENENQRLKVNETPQAIIDLITAARREHGDWIVMTRADGSGTIGVRHARIIEMTEQSES